MINPAYLSRLLSVRTLLVSLVLVALPASHLRPGDQHKFWHIQLAIAVVTAAGKLTAQVSSY